MQTSTQAHNRQTIRRCRLDGRGLPVVHIPHRGLLREGVLAALLVAAPAIAPAFALPGGQEGPQRVQFHGTGARASGSGLPALAEQKGEHWLGSLIEVFAPVTPKCETVADQHAKKECQQGERSFSQRWEQFRHEHPLFIAELILSLITFAIGFGMAAS